MTLANDERGAINDASACGNYILQIRNAAINFCKNAKLQSLFTQQGGLDKYIA